jgi:hypothetical protein
MTLIGYPVMCERWGQMCREAASLACCTGAPARAAARLAALLRVAERRGQDR